MMISKTAEYALRLMMSLTSSPETPMSANELAKITKVPRSYLTRVMQSLVAAKLVESRGGPGGGYVLASATCELTILDIINAVAPFTRITACPLGLETHTSLCPLHAELDKAIAAMEAAFASVTIRTLLASTGPIVPLRE